MMDGLKKALGNAPIFVIAYIIFMLPTYYLPYLGSNSSILQGTAAAAGASGGGFFFMLHLGAMLALCFFCWVRGAYVAKGWLVIFPILAIAFDFVPGLSLIPLIPTWMHLAAIILGVVGAKAVVPGGPPSA